MGKVNARLDSARRAYREALDAARAQPTPEAWGRLLAAGKELSAAEDPRSRGRRGRRPAQRTDAAAVIPEGALVDAVIPEPTVDNNLEGLE